MATRKVSPAQKSDSSSRPSTPVHSISSEQAFLETYFLVLSQFGFDKAKELAEKESTLKKGSLPLISPWFTLIGSLINLAVAEKTYSSLSFVAKKRFRKDSLSSYYQTLDKELEKLSEVCSVKPVNNALLPEVISYGVVAELCRHLNQFVQARQDCMKFYENLAASSINNPGINYIELVKSVEAIRNKYAKLFHHPILDPIKSSFRCIEELDCVLYATSLLEGGQNVTHYGVTHEVTLSITDWLSFAINHKYSKLPVEMDLLHHIFQAQCDLAEWKFMASLLHLHDSKIKLLSWNKVLPLSSVKDSFTGSLSVKKGFELKMFGGGSRKQIEVPLVFQWLARFHASLVAKFSLYFHSTLSDQSSSPSEMKTLTAKASVDYVGKIASFLRRADATYICLMLDTHDLEDSYKGPGYHLPYVKVDPPTGIHTYPVIFSYPSKCPTKLWPGVVSLVQNHEESLSQEKIVYLFDDKMQTTYYLAKADMRITMVVIFQGKKNERDSYVVSFLQDTTAQLRNTKVLNILKTA